MPVSCIGSDLRLTSLLLQLRLCMQLRVRGAVEVDWSWLGSSVSSPPGASADVTRPRVSWMWPEIRLHWPQRPQEQGRAQEQEGGDCPLGVHHLPPGRHWIVDIQSSPVTHNIEWWRYENDLWSEIVSEWFFRNHLFWDVIHTSNTVSPSGSQTRTAWVSPFGSHQGRNTPRGGALKRLYLY